MKRFIILILTLLSLVQVYGCGISGKSNVKIVVSNDVTSESDQITKNDKVPNDDPISNDKQMGTNKEEVSDYIKSMEEIGNSYKNLDYIPIGLEKGDYFNPLFYMEGEVYGYIYKGADSYLEGKDESDGYLVNKLESEPLLGIATEYLYKIDKNNKLVETDKKTRYSFDGKKKEIFNTKNQKYEVEDIYFMDTNVIKEPWRLLDIANGIKDLKNEIDKEPYNYDLDFFRVNNVSGTDRYLMIERFAGQAIYLYDMEENKFYSNVSNIRNGEIFYIEHLNSLLWINSDGFTINKIILKGNQFYLQGFVELSVEKEISKVRVKALNHEEILLFHDVLMDDTIYQCTNLFKTQLVSKYNFRTNQYEYIYKSPSNEAVYYDYLGHNIYMMEKFRQEGEYIVPLVKSIQQVIDKKVNVIYEERLSGDTFANYPIERVIVNEDGTELFIAWQLYDVGKLINTKDVKYRRISLN